METTSLIQEPQKKQKLNEEEDIDGNNKCLSNLPKEVLLHIISSLSTKDAVRTSVLSKRWEYMWVSIPNLVFERSLRSKRTLLMNFVDRALCLRDSDIKRFILSCDVLSDASRVNTWISAVVRHNVQELYIELENFKGDFSLPYCLFTCKTLTSLHLNMWYMILKLPPTICFSNLKILIIESVTFSNERLTQQLFSGLPVLEELQLHECKWGGLKTVSISAPKLRSLSIHEIEMQNCRYGDGRQVMIFGDSLQEFYYDGFLHRDFCLYNSFSLEVSEIHVIDDDETPRQMAYHVYKLLIGLSNVKFLTLHCGMVEVCLLLCKYKILV
jgi:hypothetical protein